MTTPFLLLIRNATAIAFQQTRKSARRMKNIHRRNDGTPAAIKVDKGRPPRQILVGRRALQLPRISLSENGFPDFPHMR
jgi:hypothetical protein